MRAFEPALLGKTCSLELPGGRRVALPVDRWQATSGPADEPLLAACHGPTLDIGCGPGRLTQALSTRGILALGVDSSPVAVHLTKARGVVALCRSVFERLPAEGCWQHALLADGNIGIGGDPLALLRRILELLRPDGSLLVEVEPPGTGVRTSQVRLHGVSVHNGWFPWASVSADALDMVAAPAGMRVDWLVERSGRWFAELTKRSPRSSKVSPSTWSPATHIPLEHAKAAFDIASNHTQSVVFEQLSESDQ